MEEAPSVPDRPLSNAFVQPGRAATPRTLHILRSDSAGLTLYMIPTRGRGGPEDALPYREPYALVYESAASDGSQVQELIAETDCAESAQALIDIIEAYCRRLRRHIARLLSGAMSMPLEELANYGNIQAKNTERAVLAQLQALATQPLPESAYRGFVEAVRSSMDHWVHSRQQIRCDWLQRRVLASTPVKTP
jgi:hypothetical protein